MPTFSFPFSGGVLTIPAYGQREKIRFVGTWADGETWKIPFTSTLTGNFTVGAGNVANKTIACGLKLRNRMYLGIGTDFALSSNGDPTLWEEQDAGAAVIQYLSQFGPQDTIQGFASMQGRLAVISKLSAQIWSIDADPALFALQQTLDNTGTPAPLSIRSIGDLDVYYLDYVGIRSLRAKESTLNAYINGIGIAIDLLIRQALLNYDASQACAVVEPTTKQYWLYLNGDIYVLSNYPESKIVAWSTYKATIPTLIEPDSGAPAILENVDDPTAILDSAGEAILENY